MSASGVVNRLCFVLKFLCSMSKFQSCINFHLLIHAFMYINDSLHFFILFFYSLVV